MTTYEETNTQTISKTMRLKEIKLVLYKAIMKLDKSIRKDNLNITFINSNTLVKYSDKQTYLDNNIPGNLGFIENNKEKLPQDVQDALMEACDSYLITMFEELDINIKVASDLTLSLTHRLYPAF